MKYVLRVGGAALLAFLLAVVGGLMARQESGGDLLAFLFIAGLVVYSIVLIKLVNRVGFWFCIVFAIEWALLPMAAAVNASQVKGTGCAGFGAAIAGAVLLGVTIPVGAIGFLVFLALAFFVFRKRGEELAVDRDEVWKDRSLRS